MFEASVVITVLMILTAWIPYQIRSVWLCVPVFVAWIMLWGYICLGMTILYFAPAIGLLYCFLAVAFLFARPKNLNRNWFGVICLSCAMAAYGIAIAEFIPAYREHQELLSRYPAVDLKPRLSYELVGTSPTAGDGPTLSGNVNSSPKYQERSLDELNDTLRGYLDLGTMRIERRRTDRRMAFQALMRVHEGFVADFISQPGVGRSRIPGVKLLRKSNFLDEWDGVRLDVPPDQPHIRRETSAGVGDGDFSDQLQTSDSRYHELAARLATPIPGESSLQHLHVHSIANFAPRNSFGGVSDRMEARGFEAHAFHISPSDSIWPDSQVDWQLSRLELVSLLKHHPAAAYVSDHLPAMDELKDAPTRAVTAFESQAITKLVDGDDLVVERSGDREITMIGAIRAITDCRDCHRVPLGGLLGAFSYKLTLQSKPPAMTQNGE
jgi:hypothetical protein